MVIERFNGWFAEFLAQFYLLFVVASLGLIGKFAVNDGTRRYESSAHRGERRRPTRQPSHIKNDAGLFGPRSNDDGDGAMHMPWVIVQTFIFHDQS